VPLAAAPLAPEPLAAAKPLPTTPLLAPLAVPALAPEPSPLGAAAPLCMTLPVLAPCVPEAAEPLPPTSVSGDEAPELHAAAAKRPNQGRVASQWTRFMVRSGRWRRDRLNEKEKNG